MRKVVFMRNVVKIFSILCFLIITMELHGQQKDVAKKIQQSLAEGDQLFTNFSYIQSINSYKKALALDSNNVSAKVKIAEAYLKLQDTKEAEIWYRKGLSSENNQDIPLYHQFNYAEVLQANGHLEESLHWYELYKQNAPNDARVDRKIEGIHNLPKLYQDSAKYTIEFLNINSKGSDFAPAFYKNGLVFVSSREEVAKKKRYNATNSAFFDIYYSAFKIDNTTNDTTLDAPEKFSKVINSKFHEGPVTFYDNDQKMIFTRNNYLNGKANSNDEKTLQLQLFYTEKEGEAEWKNPVLLSINDKQYSIGHPTTSSDGRFLYFSSTLPGGSGGTDLYVSEWKEGNYGQIKNLGNMVNTEGDEMFPFLHNDSILYFASNGYGGLGGLDIYRYHLNNDKLENVGYPINSTKDDFGLILNPEGSRGYFASNRQNEDDNIYKIIKNGPKPDPVVLVKEEPVPPPDTVREMEIYYTVQILALINPKTVKKSFLQDLDLQGVLKHDGKDGFHRYTYGVYATFEQAEEMLNKIKAKGYQDAFVRKEERYKELSKKPGMEVKKLYEVEKAP